MFPQFIDIARPQAPQYAILSVTTFLVGIVVMMGYHRARREGDGTMKDERHLKWINRTLGGAFVAAGVALTGFRRAAVPQPWFSTRRQVMIKVGDRL